MVAKTIIAQYVKEMRKKYKLTQVDLFEKAGLAYASIVNLKLSKITLRLDKVKKILELFDSECTSCLANENLIKYEASCRL